MDNGRFDNLTRTLARATTRRGALKALLGGLAIGLTGLRPSASEAATGSPTGSPCSRSTDCASRICKDGVCCTSACTGQCEACNLAGLAGTCSPVVGNPVGGRPACPGTGPCKGVCNGQNRTSCAFPDSAVGCGSPTCGGGFQTTYACGGNGTCHPTTTSCGLYACGATTCLTTCTSSAQCVGTAFCAGGVCQGDQPLGQACTGPDQCQSGFCVDGVCCTTACSGTCQACNVAGNLGFCTEEADGATCQGGVCCDGECVNTQTSLEHCGACDRACRLAPTAGSCEKNPICVAGSCTFTPQPQGTVCRPPAPGGCDVAEVCDGSSLACPPNRFAPATQVCRPAAPGGCDVAENCTGTGPDCPADRFQPNTHVCRPAAPGGCDVAESCTGTSAICPADAFRPTTFECRAASCSNGVATLRATCPGNGAACPPAQTQQCAPFVCGPTACRTTCTADDHCIASHHCDDGQCRPDEGLGATCDEDSDCLSGVCAQGVCCNQACALPCNICSATNGVCTPVSCTTPGACQTGLGTCNPANGQCDYLTAANGTACGGEIGAEVCCNGSCCAAGETCVDNMCQAACLALGEMCADEGECCQDGVTICEDTCCHPVAESCGSDPECCSGRCRDGEVCCARPGSNCGDDGECCTPGLGACDQGTCRCLLAGEDCATDFECCDGLTCQDGRCRPEVCQPLQGQCLFDTDCCQFRPTFCRQSCSEVNLCCRPNGGVCGEDCDCCGAEGTCQGGQCCQAEGGACPSGSGCCSGLTCSGGVCQLVCPAGSRRCGLGCCPDARECCNGSCCAAGDDCWNNVCRDCVPLRAECDPANNLCCQHEPTACYPRDGSIPSGFWLEECCRPVGGRCNRDHDASLGDCCSNSYHFTGGAWIGPCGIDGICGGERAICSANYECVSGSCRGRCGNLSPVRSCLHDSECDCDVDDESINCVRPEGVCIEQRCG